ncbi:TPA: hypothetical protein ACJK0A_004117, partial [Acinetobacter baumannii]
MKLNSRKIRKTTFKANLRAKRCGARCAASCSLRSARLALRLRIMKIHVKYQSSASEIVALLTYKKSRENHGFIGISNTLISNIIL